MNKTISINLNGLVFNLEEVAYEKLASYLNSVRNYLNDSDARDEIVKNIEARIAELFIERLKNKQVILEAEVDVVIIELGGPEYISANAGKKVSGETNDTNYSRAPRRIFRDTEEGVLAGVCSGIGHYFGIDPAWLRIAFLLVALFIGSGFILYLVLWIAIPKAVTRAEKLQMRGKPVNLETLENSFKEEMNELGSKAEKTRTFFKSSGWERQLIEFLKELFKTLYKALLRIVSWIGHFLGFGLLMLGLLGFLIWLLVILGIGDAVRINGNALSRDNIVSLFDLVFSTHWQSLLFSVGLSLLVVSPVLAVLFSGIRLIFVKKFNYRWLGSFTTGLFFTGIVACIVSGAFVIRDFRSQGKIIQSVPLNKFSTDTINIMTNPSSVINLKRSMNFGKWHIYFNDEDKYMLGGIRIKIEKHDIEKPVFQVVTKAYGRNKIEAVQTADQLRYYVKQKGDSLFFNPRFKLNDGSHWRGQEVEFKIKVPPGTYFRFDDEMVKHIRNLYYPPVENNKSSILDWIWKPGQERIECVNCPEID